jgi:hypothetical protein
MKQVTPKPFNVYEFNELSKQAQQVAYDFIKDEVIDDRFTFFDNDCHEILKDVFNLLDTKQVIYSLTSSQGDGLSFTCDNFNSVTINEAIFNDEATPEAVKNNIKRVNEDLKVKTVINDGRNPYAHESQVTVYLPYQDMPDYIMDAIQQAYAKQYLKICKQLKDNGYRLYDVTMEDAAEYADNVQMDFLEDGSYYHE